MKRIAKTADRLYCWTKRAGATSAVKRRARRRERRDEGWRLEWR